MLRPAFKNHAAVFLYIALAVSLSLSTLKAGSTLNFPRLSFEQNTLTGFGIVNPANEDAVVTVTAFGSDGKLLSSSGFRNPAQLIVPANRQVSRLVSELFGSTLSPSTIGWIQATSPTDGLTGFFLYLDSFGTFFDGADTPPAAPRIVFNQARLDSGFTTELNIVNTQSAPAIVRLELRGADSAPLGKTIEIAAEGMIRLDAATFFGTVSGAPGTYVTATSNTAISGFEFIKPPAGDLFGLNARNATEQLRNLYFPQMAVLGSWKTELGLVNYSASRVIVTVSAYKPDGTLYGISNLKNNPVTRSLDGGASMREDVASLFGFSGESVLDGWIKVESTSAAVNGYLSYGTSRAAAAVAVSPQGFTRGILPHIATSKGFFTGIAALNPGMLAANVRILAIQPNGQVLGAFSTVLQPGQRLSNLIDNLIPDAGGQAGGLIWVKSDQPIYLTEILGNGSTLANVPVQVVPENYRPDRELLSLRLIPTQAAVQVGASQNFRVENGSGSFDWRVNGISGGNTEVGTIGSTGVYKAPPVVPVPQVVTITAENPSQIVGASADVLQKEVLVAGLGHVQSVAYLSSPKRLYTTEVTIASASKEAAQTAASEIFEISPTSPRVSVVSYNNELVAKMVSFTASDDKEYLLLAGQIGGRIIRLDPVSRQSTDVVTGLNQPTTLVMDPVSGNLLVAEADKITLVPKTVLEAVPGAKRSLSSENPSERSVTLFAASAVNGIAVDGCTGNIFFSNSKNGALGEYVRLTGEVRTVLELSDPGPLLGVNRGGVSCPFSLHLMVIQRTLDRISLVVPSNSSVTPWMGGRGATDIAFLPRGNPFTKFADKFSDKFAEKQGVLLVETTGQLTGQVSLVSVADLYKTETENALAPRVVTVSIQPAHVDLGGGATQQFASTVTGAENKAVIWATDGGTITETGFYTAPDFAGSFRVTATSVADPSKSAIASVTVRATVEVSISPSSVLLAGGARQQFTATVKGAKDKSVIWTATGGTISNTGLYVAPKFIERYTVTATSVADPGKSASATVTVISVGLTVYVVPDKVTLVRGATQQFRTVVTGSVNTDVTWKADGGTITNTGFYTAPNKLGTFTITATSVADPAKSGTATLSVVSSTITVAIEPATITLQLCSTGQFTAIVTGTSNRAVIWSTDGGTITSTGLFKAPCTMGIFSVTATSVVEPTKSATATVIITAPFPPNAFTGFGTPKIDGVLSPGEWDGAAKYTFFANLPVREGGGTTPAVLFVMNDATNLYLAVKVLRSTLGSSSVGFEFSNHNTGVAENGDDVLLLNPAIGFLDEVRTNKSPPCAPGSPPAYCGVADTEVGGTNDGRGAVTNNGAFSFYEISHPLNSGDRLNDFSLTTGDTVGFFLMLRFCDTSGCADAFVPGPGFRNYGHIVVAGKTSAAIADLSISKSRESSKQ